LYWKEQKQESLQGCPLSGAHYTVIGSYHSMYMNQVLENYYLYTRQIKHIDIPGWTTYVIHPGIFFMLDPASKENIVGMIRQMTTAF